MGNKTAPNVERGTPLHHAKPNQAGHFQRPPAADGEAG